MKGKQAIRSRHIEIALISFEIRDGRQTGSQALATSGCSHFYLTSETEGKQAITSQRLVIVHISFDSKDGRQQAITRQHLANALISFDFRDGRQTGNQKSAT
jgi:hypothetical protein